MAQARLHNEVMVAYDIEDSKNRTKLFKKLKDMANYKT
jgi:CRISPR/Cas system-associated endoribonuclease Cas2